jgi:Tol biopolymer transport system component
MESNEPLDVAGVVAGRPEPRLCVVREPLPSVYVQTLKTGERHRVSARAGVNQAPAWSPDGKKLALTLSTRDGNLDVYVLDLATQASRASPTIRGSTPSRSGRRTAKACISPRIAPAARRSTRSALASRRASRGA